MIDIQEKKNKIIYFLKIGGPSLPVRIAKTIEMDPVFASAILSELLGTKQIKMSHMKVGSSPFYLLPGQEQKLENYTENLNPIEKKAFLKLKENKTLTDENEEPSIRVALRNIKDFAIPFKSKEKIMWEYAFEDKDKIEDKKEPIKQKEEIQQEENKKEPIKQQIEKPQTKTEAQKIENIFNEKTPKPEFLNEVKTDRKSVV